MDQKSPVANVGKFLDPEVTASGAARAKVALTRPETLWFNTGTLCNITCGHCYIESSPGNDRLVYLTPAEVRRFLDEAGDLGWPLREAGFTGGEPFLNPGMIAMAGIALERGLDVLVLTNAMGPMMRAQVRAGLTSLRARHGDRLSLRVSLDHPDPARHDAERGAGSFAATLRGMDWLAANGFRMAVAGRSLWHDRPDAQRDAFAALFAARGYPVDAHDPSQCVIFPEMDETAEVPEITTACWTILDRRPDSVMCASSRMVVRRRGAKAATVAACTLLPYDPRFDLGPTLAGAAGPVALNHPHCARFCVLGGAKCTA